MDQEHSEALLYHNSLLAEYDLPAALEHLHKIEDTVCAPGTIYEFEADYLMKLNDKSKYDDVVRAWERLVERNPGDQEYLIGLEKVKNVQPEDRKAFWDDLAKKYPKSNAVKLIPLEFLQGTLGLLLSLILQVMTSG
jgi:NMDA receptor-regulated protein 1